MSKEKAFKPFNHGKEFHQYMLFRQKIKEGKSAIILGPDFVVMSLEHYEKLTEDKP